MIKNNKAFTLVELIVVITILAILGTIAFISLQGYSAQARDSKRLSDIQNIKKSLELFSLNVGKYPIPDNGKEILYETELVWNQGIIGDKVTKNLSRNLNELPLDPLTELEYIYSTINTQTKYELLSVYESDLITIDNNLFEQTYAQNFNYPKIDGNYNGIYVKTPSYYIPTPSIITSEDTSLGLTLNDSNINSQIITGGNNIPTIGLLERQTNKLENFTLQVFTGTITKASDIGKEDFANALISAYSGTTLANQNIYKILLETPSEDLIKLVDNIVFSGPIYNLDQDGLNNGGREYLFLTSEEFEANKSSVIIDADNGFVNYIRDLSYTPGIITPGIIVETPDSIIKTSPGGVRFDKNNNKLYLPIYYRNTSNGNSGGFFETDTLLSYTAPIVTDGGNYTAMVSTMDLHYNTNSLYYGHGTVAYSSKVDLISKAISSWNTPLSYSNSSHFWLYDKNTNYTYLSTYSNSPKIIAISPAGVTSGISMTSTYQTTPLETSGRTSDIFTIINGRIIFHDYGTVKETTINGTTFGSSTTLVNQGIFGNISNGDVATPRKGIPSPDGDVYIYNHNTSSVDYGKFIHIDTSSYPFIVNYPIDIIKNHPNISIGTLKIITKDNDGNLYWKGYDSVDSVYRVYKSVRGGILDSEIVYELGSENFTYIDANTGIRITTVDAIEGTLKIEFYKK